MMKKILNAIWKILVLTIVFFIVNAIMGVVLPLSNDMMAAMSANDQAAFMPLFLINIIINLTVMYIMLTNLTQRKWKLLVSVWAAFWGLFTLMNAIELYWYNESFPLFTYLDVTKMIISSLVSYGITTVIGILLTGGFKNKPETRDIKLSIGKYGWKVLAFSIFYSLFYYCCGFITRIFPEVRDFYASWAVTMEPIPILLAFNVVRGALWFLFTLPILAGAKTRKQAFFLAPLILFTGTAMAVMVPSAVMPGIVRLAHFIELGFSMIVVGIVMVWLFMKKKEVLDEETA